MKKILLSLFGIIVIGLVNFGYCFNSTSFDLIGTVHVDSSNYTTYLKSNNTVKLFSSYDTGLFCAVMENMTLSSYYNGSSTNQFGFSINAFLYSGASRNNSIYKASFPNFTEIGFNGEDFVYCLSNTIDNSEIYMSSWNNSANFFTLITNNGLSFDYSFYKLKEDFTCPICPSCSQCESDLATCQSDLNTCQNDLLNCGGSMTGDCQQNTGDIQWSSLYINDIQHLGSENINITIPEEISWNYTGNEEIFDLTVEGYNVDSEYIAGIIENQTTLPNKVDLNNIITGVIPLFVPGLFIVLFIYFVFRFIKKVF